MQPIRITALLLCLSLSIMSFPAAGPIGDQPAPAAQAEAPLPDLAPAPEPTVMPRVDPTPGAPEPSAPAPEQTAQPTQEPSPGPGDAPEPSPFPEPSADVAANDAEQEQATPQKTARSLAVTQGAVLAQVHRQLDVQTFSIIAGQAASGSASQLELEDQKVLRLLSDGTGIETEFTFATELPAGDLTRLTLRLAFKATAAADLTVKAFEPAEGKEQPVAQLVPTGQAMLWDVELPQPAGRFISDEGQIKLRLTLSGGPDAALELDQAQLLLSFQAGVDTAQVQNYPVQSGVVEQGAAQTGSGFDSLAHRDGVSFKVESAANKAAWYSVVHLAQPRERVHTLQLEYAGRVSAATNPLWLSLYRFDTNNWEAVALLPGDTEPARRTILLSGDKIQSYLSPDNDLRVRIYNSAAQSFVRETDFLSVTAVSEVLHSQTVCLPQAVTTEFGTSTGAVAELEKQDGQCFVTQSDGAKKIAVQIGFQIGVEPGVIRELNISLRLKSQTNINTQYISLLNHETGRFSVVKELAGSEDFENVNITLDSLLDIRKYLSPTGGLTLRVYNSAAAPFTREMDMAQIAVTHGGFQSFTVAQISDVHELIGTQNFQSIITEVNDRVKPTFSIVTGDITDHGTPAQYELYLEDAQRFQNPVYTTPGNHDVRWWNANGKKTFTDQVGPLYQSFEQGGVHFVLLDSTVNFELDGKLNRAQLEWLKADLAAIPADMPVILFAHHPFKINNNVTARHELLNAVKGYNVLAFMSGHVHYYGNVVEDGIPVNYITYVKDNADQEFVSIEFTPNYYYIYKHKAADHSKTLWLTGKMDNTRQMDIAVGSVQTGANGKVEVSLDVYNAPDGVASVYARIDNYGGYTQLARNADGSWSGSIDTTAYTPQLVPGAHFVGVEAFDTNGLKWTAYKDYHAPGGAAQVRWIFETGDILQASATIQGQKVYVGSGDGSLYCIDAGTGAQVWRFETAGTVISKPAVCQQAGRDRVVFGSGDGNLYCLDAATGVLLWSRPVGGSVLSDPLVENGLVYAGCGDGKIYCLDATDGEIRWSCQTGGLMRQRPVIQNGVLYAFVRDTYIWYALRADTGALLWRGNADTDESYFVCGDVRPVIAGQKLWCIDAQNTRPGYLNLATGALSWTGTLPKVSSRGMATDGALVFYSSNNGRQLTAYHADTGLIAWQKDLRYGGRDGDLQEMQIDCGLVCADGVLYHVAERGRVTALDTASGNILWCVDAAGFPERVFWATPEVGEGLILCSGIDGKLYAVELP